MLKKMKQRDLKEPLLRDVNNLRAAMAATGKQDRREQVLKDW
jgi:hypothetical protein